MKQLISAIRRRLFRPTDVLNGYEQPDLVEVIFQKTLSYKPRGDWPEISSASSVLDFGGGCGIHYKQAQLSKVRWAIVETPAMVERAAELATDQLQFFTTVSAAAEWLGHIDVMHSNGALQYTPEPEKVLKQLCDLRANIMLWSRLYFSESSETQTSFLNDNGPGSMSHLREKIVQYTRTGIQEQSFLDAHYEYEILKRGPDWFRFSLKSPA